MEEHGKLLLLVLLKSSSTYVDKPGRERHSYGFINSLTPRKKGRLEALEKRLSTSSRLSDSPSPSPSRPAFTPPQDAAAQTGDAPYAKLCQSVLNGPLSSSLSFGQ